MRTSRWDLFHTFFMIGLTTFGGGYAMLAVMRKKIVDEKQWLSYDEMVELLAVSESSPGSFSVNASTFIGFKIRKFWGSVIATLGVVLPSLLVSIILGIILVSIGDNKIFNGALKGISAGIGSIILAAFMNLSKRERFTPFNLIVFIVAATLVFFNVLSVIYVILIGAAFGIVYGFFRDRKKGEIDDNTENNA